MCISIFVCMYLWVQHVWASSGQKRALDPLEVELWMIVNHQVNGGNWTQVLCMNKGS